MISYLGSIESNYYFKVNDLFYLGINETRDGKQGLRFKLTGVSKVPNNLSFRDSWRIVSSDETEVITYWEGRMYVANYTITPQSDGSLLFSSTVGAEVVANPHTGKPSTNPATGNTLATGNTAAPGPTSMGIGAILAIGLTAWWVLGMRKRK